MSIDTFVFDVARVGECEFHLISEMQSQLIVHHPYRTLEVLKENFALSQDEAVIAWSIINDTYMTDLPLLVAPHTIAIMAILLSLLLRPSGATLSGMSSTPAINARQIESIGQAAQKAFSGANSQRANMGSNSPRSQREQSKIGKMSAWLAESSIDIEAIIDTTQEIISFYELHEQYNEKLLREQINRFVKARGLDK